jgi:hypothetical protein
MHRTICAILSVSFGHLDQRSFRQSIISIRTHNWRGARPLVLYLQDRWISHVMIVGAVALLGVFFPRLAHRLTLLAHHLVLLTYHLALLTHRLTLLAHHLALLTYHLALMAHCLTLLVKIHLRLCR